MKSFNKNHRKLLSDIFSGDRRAAEKLVAQHSGLVYKSVMYTLVSRNAPYTAEDLQDFHNTVFLVLFDNNCRKLRQFKGKNGCSLASWIRMIAVRTVIDDLRKRNTSPTGPGSNAVALENLPEIKSGEPEADFRISELEEKALIKKGVEKLPAREQLFMKLHIEKGLPVSKTARIMQLSEANAYTLKHRIIKKLKTFLDDIVRAPL